MHAPVRRSRHTELNIIKRVGIELIMETQQDVLLSDMVDVANMEMIAFASAREKYDLITKHYRGSPLSQTRHFESAIKWISIVSL